MKIKGLENFKRQIEKRLIKELGLKNEPWIVVDRIEIDYFGEDKPFITVNLRAGYNFGDNKYQYSRTISLSADGSLEYIAGMFANELEHCDAELI